MKTPDASWLGRAQAALDKLTAQLLNDPAVSLIDVGADPNHQQSTPVLRVYVRGGGAPAIPDQIDGIPVRVVRGEYEIQEGEP